MGFLHRHGFKFVLMPVTVCPIGKMDTEWPDYPSATAELSEHLSVHKDYQAERCRLWKDNGMFAYAWMN